MSDSSPEPGFRPGVAGYGATTAPGRRRTGGHQSRGVGRGGAGLPALPALQIRDPGGAGTRAAPRGADAARRAEDLAGKPFVGPAGRLLDRALEEAGIPRSDTFVTNAVKHFKHEPRGKRRLHKRPNAYEIDRCRWWLTQELAIVRPKAVVALGATAARSLFRRPLAIGKARGRELAMEDGTAAFVTIHPSLLLRIREAADREREYRAFVLDLRRAAAYLRTSAKAA
jgi:uracil-DNA glycosylase